MTSMAEPTSEDNKPNIRRYDALAAGVAVFVSVLALAVSAYSTYWQRQQTRAATWPRLMMNIGNFGKGYGVALSNAGSGLLQLDSLVVSFDGKQKRTIGELLEAVAPLGGYTEGNLPNFAVDQVDALGAGEKVEFLRIDDEKIAIVLTNASLNGPNRLSVRACYCSLLDECWTLDSNALRPVEVGKCSSEPSSFGISIPKR
jgi:hypothetical protein